MAVYDFYTYGAGIAMIALGVVLASVTWITRDK
jgi:hypothetical protein